MKTLLFLFCLISTQVVLATTELSPACERKVIREAIKNKETNLFLDFEIESVRDDLANTIVTIQGSFSDAWEDYFYSETHEIYLRLGTCEITASKVVDIFEN